MSMRRSSRAWYAMRGRRCLSSYHDVSEQLRDVMRDVPQHVAIAVTSVPHESSSPSSSSSSSTKSKYHGTTLSSFTSLTLHPYPLVAFSIRLPSRMADYLRSSPSPSSLLPSSNSTQTQSSSSATNSTSDSSSSPSNSSTSTSNGIQEPSSNRRSLTISLLSQPSQSLAHALSKPMSDQSSTFSSDSLWTDTDPPSAASCVGSLRCEVLSSTLLRDVCYAHDDVEVRVGEGDGEQGPSLQERSGLEENADRGRIPGEGDGASTTVHGSELFICKVLQVTRGSISDRDQPLLYWRQRYTSVNSTQMG
ncbi:flavin reductase like domain-domain-containing protein [Naematelia encephala]|uniref:Flavin reductase like domain-domain-containing protein n=1 Tax=Naematelia encephala TaxID=71784 RepID=A0A1Y2AVD5_9TREE|nr:flavin reductase like domain-domain-containing protein [Naematelia encephala]